MHATPLKYYTPTCMYKTWSKVQKIDITKTWKGALIQCIIAKKSPDEQVSSSASEQNYANIVSMPSILIWFDN